ncbi:hypothetical protein CKF54_01075 [Psittacicella hinzii]|uniref:HTH araC/xylS-type domain-containing protein n=1 Tax=Psittacicella hinzii TaxID=2028575 RepID=A0A3A1Y9P8_9GAMM|nr:AraC family transcriptional regulator [Psittacicella hinzii]RIY34271.1 hypothetical protein CKF54_01075 [Psittacicella hinzii]
MKKTLTLGHTAIQRFTTLGIDIATLYQALRIKPLDSSMQAQVSIEQYQQIFAYLAKQFNDPLIGLKLGEVENISQLDPGTFVAAHSKNFGEALEKLKRFKKVTCPEILQYQTLNSSIMITVNWESGESLDPIVLDSFFSNLLTMLKFGLGTAIKPQAVYLKRSKASPAYQEFFGCPVYFASAQDVIYFASYYLEQPFITYNPDLLSYLVPGLEQQAPENYLEQVKSALFTMMNGSKPSLENLAHHLHTSKRTLQRRLTEMGVNYQQLLVEVRLQVACHMLRMQELDCGEIAFYLGFEELNSFNRFFIQATGYTPNAYRQEFKGVSN